MKLNFGGVAKPKKFELGRLVVTDAIVDAMKDADFTTFLYTSFIRYCANDWGDIPKSDAKICRQNLKHGGNLGGRYVNEAHGWEIWILTSDIRDRTIISFPDKMKDEETVE